MVVTETAGYKRISEPVEVTYLYYPDQMHEPEREIRVFHYDWRRQKASAIPCQVVDVEIVEKSEEPKRDEQGHQ